MSPSWFKINYFITQDEMFAKQEQSNGRELLVFGKGRPQISSLLHQEIGYK